MLLCSEYTIGNDILVFTLREMNMLYLRKGQASQPGDRLYNCGNYYVAPQKLQGTSCQMSTARLRLFECSFAALQNASVEEVEKS